MSESKGRGGGAVFSRDRDRPSATFLHLHTRLSFVASAFLYMRAVKERELVSWKQLDDRKWEVAGHVLLF